MARRLILAAALVVLVAACAEDEPVFDPSIIPAAVQAEVDPIGIEAVACDEPASQVPTLPRPVGGSSASAC